MRVTRATLLAGAPACTGDVKDVDDFDDAVQCTDYIDAVNACYAESDDSGLQGPFAEYRICDSPSVAEVTAEEWRCYTEAYTSGSCGSTDEIRAIADRLAECEEAANRSRRAAARSGGPKTPTRRE